MNLINKTLVLASVAMFAVACSQPEVGESVSTGDMRNITLSSFGSIDESRASWVDGDGIAWEQSDADKLGFVSNIGDVSRSRALTINEDDGTAQFGIAVGASADRIFAYYPYREGALAYLPDEGSFTISYDIEAAQLQAAAGEFSMADVPMASADIVTVPEGYSEVNNPMVLVGSLVRFLIYSDEVAYQSEAVKSVELRLPEGNILNGTCLLSGGWDTPVTVETPTEGGNVSRVTLQTDYLLTDIADNSAAKGVYLCVAPVEAESCTYVVVTDKATYTFASEKTKTFADNTIHNVALNLSKATDRTENSGEITHTLTWDKDQAINVGAAKGLGYYGPTTVSYDGVTVSDMENVSFAVVDLEDNPVTWLKASWENTNNYNLQIDYERNAATEGRSGRIYVEYMGVRSTTCLQVNQDPGNGVPFIVPTLTKVYQTDILAAGETVAEAATLSLEVDGEVVSDIAPYVQYVTLSCGAAEAAIEGSTVKIVFPENTLASEKTYTLKASTDDGESSVKFTQAAGEGTGEVPQFSYSIEKITPAYGTEEWFGMLTGGDKPRWFRIYNIKDAAGEALAIPLDDDTLEMLFAQVFTFGEIEADDMKAGAGQTDDHSFVSFSAFQQGDSVFVDVVFAAREGGEQRYVKIITNDSDGNPLYTWVIWQ
ncbi:MAG TPA: hypothetical protein H9919_01510 [Candidatus Alistipes excrementipullorum]|nr:hypothetical protein [Candidatus Alistipes excrementipullorum]